MKESQDFKKEKFCSFADLYVEAYNFCNNSFNSVMAGMDLFFGMRAPYQSEQLIEFSNKETESLAAIKNKINSTKEALSLHKEISNSIKMNMFGGKQEEDLQVLEDTIAQLDELDSWCEARLSKMSLKKTGRNIDLDGKLLLKALEQLHYDVFEKKGSLYVGGFYLDKIQKCMSQIGIQRSQYTFKSRLVKIQDNFDKDGYIEFDFVASMMMMHTLHALSEHPEKIRNDPPAECIQIWTKYLTLHGLDDLKEMLLKTPEKIPELLVRIQNPSH